MRSDELAGGLRASARRFRGLARRWMVPPPPREADRVALALSAVAAVERGEPALPDPEPRVLYASEVVIGPEVLPARVRTMLPGPRARGWDVQDGYQRIEAEVAADLVVRAKYDLGTSVKLRAAYAEDGLAVGILPSAPFGTGGVSRTVRAHAIVGRHAPELAPALLAFGEAEGQWRYLVERWVDGRPLMTPRRLAGAVPELVAGLQRVHLGYGSREVPLSRWAPGLREEWEQLRGNDLVPEELFERTARLIAQDGTMRTSWTHGDPVASNVIDTDHGLVLIDWENSGLAPVMVDGAKLHLLAADPQATLEAVLGGFGAPASEGAYGSGEQLALVHARGLVDHPRRLAGLRGHPREEMFARQGPRRVERLAEALDA